MSTVATLIAFVKTLYAPASVKTDAELVAYMNMAQNELSPYFGIMAVDESIETVADDDEYDLPAGINDITDIDYIEIDNDPPDLDYIVESASMKVGSYTIANQPSTGVNLSVTHTANGNTDTLGTITITGTVAGTAGTTEEITPIANSTVYGSSFFTAISAVTGASWVTNGTADTITVGIRSDRYDRTKYYPSFKDPSARLSYSFRQNYNSSGTKSLVFYPAPDETDCVMHILYRKRLTALSESSTSASPEFDSLFHNLLAVYAARMVAAEGPSPDAEKANDFMQMYEDGVGRLWKLTQEQEIENPTKPKYNRHWAR
jgi:hypothetical protein